MIPGTRNNAYPEQGMRTPNLVQRNYEKPTTPRQFDPPTFLRKHNGPTPTYTAQPSRIRQRWPPPPSVEDEETSLSREQSPTLPDLEEGQAQMKGSVDQMPILFEIGKENEDCDTVQKKSRRKQDSRQRWSSDDSYGPDTPNDSSASDSNDTRRRRPYETSAASMIKDNLENKRRPEGRNRSVSTKLPDRPPPKLPSPRAATFNQSHSYSRDGYPIQDPQKLYPGTLEELKAHPKERENLVYAHRQRTMSGSNNAADHRPANIRHMSAMGYSGECHTPSFPRDHPALYPSSVPTTPRQIPPQFTQPRNKDHDAIVDSSDSDISPDEIYDRRSRQRRASSKSQSSSGTGYIPPPKPAPTKESIKQQSRQSSSERRPGKPPMASEMPTHRRQDSHGKPSKHSPAASLGASPYPSPPASPRSTSRPSSREGSRPLAYPTIANKSQQPKRLSRPPSPTRGAPHPDNYATSNLRYSSRPSSPVLQSAREPNDQNQFPKTDGFGGRRDALKPDGTRSRDPSPIQIPRSSASPKPSFRGDTQQPERIPTPRVLPVPNLDAGRRPLSSDGSSQAFIPPPAAGVSGLHRTPSNSRRPAIPLANPVAQNKPAKANPPRTQLIPCPRPGFTTKYTDWWTIPQIPALDICPDCTQSLRDNGLETNFIRSQPRPAGTQTRCDMNVSWVRISCILILSGREKLDMLKYLMDILADVDPCPKDQPGIRKKWYRVYDEDAEKHVPGFSVCPACVESVRVLFPNLKGSFKSHTSTSQDPKICDLSAYVPRFAKYVDLLDNISTKAKLYREAPDTKKFVRMAKDFAGVPPCTQDNQFRGRAWHFPPHIPDFTVCGECFMEVVRPAQRAGFDVADEINRKILIPRDPEKALSCQLYSPRMRAIFEESCRNQSIATLREHALIRVAKERELQHRFALAQALPEEQQEQTLEMLIDEWKRWQ